MLIAFPDLVQEQASQVAETRAASDQRYNGLRQNRWQSVQQPNATVHGREHLRLRIWSELLGEAKLGRQGQFCLGTDFKSDQRYKFWFNSGY